jgi:TonB family protein
MKLNGRKTIIIIFLICIGALVGYKLFQTISERIKPSNPFIMADTSKLINMLNSKFPADTILKYMGPGTHAFYLVVGKVDKSDHLTYYFTHDIGIVANSTPQFVMKELEQTSNNGNPFEQGVIDKDGIFKFSGSSDIYTAYKLIGVYELRIGINTDKKNIYPWTVISPDLNKYKYKSSSINTNEFPLYPRAIIGGYEELSKKIAYPDEARKLGVNGRIMIDAYIDEKGNVLGTHLDSGIGFGCDEAALAAVKQIKFYPSEFGKSQVILPIDFALEYVSTSFDLTSTKFKFDPKASYNNITFNVVNFGKLPSPNSKPHIFLYIDKKPVFMSLLSQVKKETTFWVRWDKVKEGMHEYTISIDPLNNLKESNRDNNIVSGTFEVK